MSPEKQVPSVCCGQSQEQSSGLESRLCRPLLGTVSWGLRFPFSRIDHSPRKKLNPQARCAVIVGGGM